MPVYIVCDKCQKRLKIPENVVGQSIKCPACNSVFKADPAKVQPAEPPVHTAAIAEEDEVLPARKKAAPTEDVVVAKPHKQVVRPVEEDDDEPRPARRRRRADDDDEDYDDEDEAARARTPWYVMLPLVILSLCPLGLALLWPLGFSMLDMDRGLTLSNDSRWWLGVALALVLTLICLIVSLTSARSWLRLVIVLLLLAIGYGGSFGAVHWWKSLGLGKEENKPAQPLPAPGQNAPPPGQ